MCSIFYPPMRISEVKNKLNFIPPSYCQILIKNGFLESETIGKKVYISERSIEKFKRAFQIENYYTASQCNEKLTELDLKDDYEMIKYNGLIPKFDFNVSVKKLVEKGYLEYDRFFGKYIPITSFDKCVVILKGIIETNRINKNEENKRNFIQSEIEKRLESQIHLWDTEYFHSLRNHTSYDKPKPTLSDEEIKEIEEIAESKFNLNPPTNGKIERLPKVGVCSPSPIKNPYKKSIRLV